MPAYLCLMWRDWYHTWSYRKNWLKRFFLSVWAANAEIRFGKVSENIAISLDGDTKWPISKNKPTEVGVTKRPTPSPDRVRPLHLFALFYWVPRSCSKFDTENCILKLLKWQFTVPFLAGLSQLMLKVIFVDFYLFFPFFNCLQPFKIALQAVFRIRIRFLRIQI